MADAQAAQLTEVDVDLAITLPMSQWGMRADKWCVEGVLSRPHSSLMLNVLCISPPNEISVEIDGISGEGDPAKLKLTRGCGWEWVMCGPGAAVWKGRTVCVSVYTVC
ncbi:hypothetical protein Bbelb_016680 [Branchiostoma belcheri]|nr:hypothetical protein Bbelb_016680 [Branchiostoma belcheri]